MNLEKLKGSPTGAVSREIDLLRRILLDTLNVEMNLGVRQKAIPKSSEGMSDADFRDLLKRVMMLNNATKSEEETD